MLLVCNIFFHASTTGNLFHNTSLLYQYVQWNPFVCTHTHPLQIMRSVFPYTSCEDPFSIGGIKKKYWCLVAYFPISLNTWLDWRKFQFVLWGLSYEDLPITQLWILMGTTWHTILMGTCSPNLWGLCFHTLPARTNSSVEEEEKGKACLVASLPVSLYS